MTSIIQPTAQKTRFSQKNYEQTKQNDPIGKISLRYNPRSSHASKKSKLENMSENIHEICGNKKFMNIGAKQRQKHSERTYDEMEKIN